MEGRLARATAALVVALIILFAPTVAGGVEKHPRAGTYAGVGTETTNPAYEVRLGFTVQGGVVNVKAREATWPGCSGGLFMSDAPIVEGKFSSDYTQPSPSEANHLKGRFTDRTHIKGTVVLERPDSASCGDPGTYTYRYTAKRYGKP